MLPPLYFNFHWGDRLDMRIVGLDVVVNCLTRHGRKNRHRRQDQASRRPPNASRSALPPRSRASRIQRAPRARFRKACPPLPIAAPPITPAANSAPTCSPWLLPSGLTRAFDCDRPPAVAALPGAGVQGHAAFAKVARPLAPAKGRGSMLWRPLFCPSRSPDADEEIRRPTFAQ
jgi:hypothetical protein